MPKKVICLLVTLISFSGHASSELERIVQAQGQLLTDNQQKITDLQVEVDQLRGQLEDTTYQLNQTIERQKNILQQLDSKASANNSSKNSSSSSPVTKKEQVTLANWSSSGDDKADYNFIVKSLSDKKQSKDTISAFQQFLKDYPKSPYRANANYWLGQISYSQGRKDDASFYFATVVKNYPKSDKAAESLYKIGSILLDKGDKVRAKAVFQQLVSQYANDKKTTDLANKKLAELN